METIPTNPSNPDTIEEQPTMSNSRFQRHLKETTLKNIFLVAAGFIILLVFFIMFGMQFLIDFSLSLQKAKDAQNTTTDVNEQTFVAPPTLNQSTSATNSAEVTISGYALPKESVVLYINGKLYDKKSVKDDNSFVFQQVTLKTGDNTIKAKAISENDKESEYSEIIVITYSNKAPTLDVSSPQDGQTFSKDTNNTNVSGKTDSGVKVTINDIWAIVDDEGNFSYNFRLQNGDNTIKLEAVDDSGNKTTKEIKVKKDQ